jgi:hypothetical protein
MYHLIDGVLYRQGANDMMMKCISKDEGSRLLRDIHSGVCGAHSSWRSIVGKAFRHRFYWPTAKDDAIEIITKCKECHFFHKQTMKHVNPLDPSISPGLLQYGESTSSVFFQGLQEVSGSYSSALIHSLSGWR